jgi:PAS domain S-box-containing protein
MPGLSPVLDVVPDIVYLRNWRGVILAINLAGARFFGVPREQLIGKTFHAHLNDERGRSLAGTNRALLARGSDRSTVKLSDAGGHLRTLESTTTLMRDSLGRPRIVCGVMRDVTDTMELTGLLESANAQLTAALSSLESDHLRQIEESEEKMRSLSAHVLSAQEDERRQVVREIHDGVGGALAALRLELQRTVDEASVGRMRSLIDRTMADIRRLSESLRPAMLDDLGLVPAIEREVSEFSNRTSLRCHLSIRGRNAAVDPEIATCAFRVFQEAMTNIVRHASATAVWIDLRVRKDGVLLSVRDDGRGIAEDDKRKPRSFGLIGMRERVAQCGGEFRIDAARGKGACIQVVLPRHASAGVR